MEDERIYWWKVRSRDTNPGARAGIDLDVRHFSLTLRCLSFSIFLYWKRQDPGPGCSRTSLTLWSQDSLLHTLVVVVADDPLWSAITKVSARWKGEKKERWKMVIFCFFSFFISSWGNQFKVKGPLQQSSLRNQDKKNSPRERITERRTLHRNVAVVVIPFPCIDRPRIS